MVASRKKPAAGLQRRSKLTRHAESFELRLGKKPRDLTQKIAAAFADTFGEKEVLAGLERLQTKKKKRR